jgi:hypothetical protein
MGPWAGSAAAPAGWGVVASIGLLAFAVVVAAAATRWPLWATLTVATASRAVVALGLYGIAHRMGVGGDESR